MPTQTQNVIVSHSFIKKSDDNSIFFVPDISAKVPVSKKIALYHSLMGEIVFAKLSCQNKQDNSIF